MPRFAAYDHTHYTRWVAVFIADMEHLTQTAPQVYQGFLDGDFVAKKTNYSLLICVLSTSKKLERLLEDWYALLVASQLETIGPLPTMNEHL